MRGPAALAAMGVAVLTAAAWGQQATPEGPLVYLGGPILTRPQIFVVFWGDGVDSKIQERLPEFYRLVVGSSDFDWISEYDTSTQQIRRGSVLGSSVITPLDSRTDLHGEDIEVELLGQIDAGTLPQPTADTFYAVYLPGGIHVTAGFWGDRSCVEFTAYHGFLAGGAMGTYGVFPRCETPCIDPSDCPATRRAVHELFEAVTDPIDNNAWVTSDGNEIADICTNSSSTLMGPDGGALSIQRLWSNRWNSCVGSQYEFDVSVRETTSADGSLVFEVATTPSHADGGTLSFEVLGLPDGGTYRTTTDALAGSTSTLTVGVPEGYLGFQARVVVQSDRYRTEAKAWIDPPRPTRVTAPAAATTGGGCSHTNDPATLPSFVGLLVFAALSRRR